MNYFGEEKDPLRPENPPEFEEGREAFRQGLNWDQNPYPAGGPIPLDYVWKCGWEYEHEQNMMDVEEAEKLDNRRKFGYE